MLTENKKEIQKQHLKYLRDHIYKVETKWPHFQRLLDDLSSIAEEVHENQTVVCLERAYVYGGYSIVAPLFDVGTFTTVDCLLKSSESHGNYQADWVNDKQFTKIKADVQSSIYETTLPAKYSDYILIPNVIHHVENQELMFKEISRVMKPGSKGYLFEALLRELHQIPDDYARFTPWGFAHMLEKQGLKMTDWKPAGGPFESIAYCWVQALQYFPEDLRVQKEKWFYEEHFPELMDWDVQYKNNLERKYTEFPVAYGIFFEKPKII